MNDSFHYQADVIKDAHRLWKARDYMRLPSKQEMESLVAMPSDERHTFMNDLITFESVVIPVSKQKSNNNRLRNLVLFLLICILIAGVVYLMVDYQRDYAEMYNQIEAMR